MFYELRTLSGFCRNLLVPVLSRNDIEPAIPVHVNNRDRLAAAKVEGVLTERDRVVTYNDRIRIEGYSRSRCTSGIAWRLSSSLTKRGMIRGKGQSRKDTRD